ncbi:MAG: radical SAM protein [Faecousia sp.]
MKTVSINVMNLCVPCENRCRYCLLSYDGKTNGVDYRCSEQYAKRFYDWLREYRPELSFLFGFGYSMEHPGLLSAIDFCRSIGSASGEFLQFDGMKFRTDIELEILLHQLKDHGIKLIDLTFYGTEEYHDRFAARKGDYRLMMRTLAMASRVGLDVSLSIPLTHENVDQIDALITQLKQYGNHRIVCFIPHGEGRGRLLEPVRFSVEDYGKLSDDARRRINWNRFKAESQWLRDGFPVTEKRVLTVTLQPENVDFFEALSFGETIAYLEKLDDDYYTIIPPVEELARTYGNPNGDRYYSARDLYLSYQRRYIADNKIKIYDINDERQCFSRRF